MTESEASDMMMGSAVLLSGEASILDANARCASDFLFWHGLLCAVYGMACARLDMANVRLLHAEMGKTLAEVDRQAEQPETLQ